ncbi:MAG TPA: S-layer homology domain-containing protein, partial [Chloroflexota bacterium]
EGETWTEAPVADVATLPYSFIGDYQGLAAKNGKVLGMWWDSRNQPAGEPYTDPAAPQIGTPTPTMTGTPPTATPTRTVTNTPTPSPTACGASGNYNIGQSTGATIVPGTVDIGNHTDDGVTFITLPFSYSLYGVPYTGANVSSNGNLQFVTNNNAWSNDCLPSATINGPTIFPHWDDLRTDLTGEGIFTSVSGSAPNRIFNIEWRAETYSGANPVNFEIRLYETQDEFDLVYGNVGGNGSTATVGVQNASGSLSTQFECNTGGLNQGLMLVFTQPPCGTPGPTHTPGATNTPPTVATNTPPPAPTETEVPPTPCAIQFSDVPPGSTFYAYVRCLACRGILGGYSDGTFRPGNNITRGQLAKIVSNSAAFVDPPGAQIYEDVPPTNTFFDFIQRLSHRGVMGGYACGGPFEPCVPPGNRPYFRPNNNATRGQISKIDVNTAVIALGWTLLNPPNSTFQDVPTGSTFYEFVETAVSHGVMGGYACGAPPAGPCVPPANKPYFLPNNNATRGQTAKIVANTFFPNCETPKK